jgi:hypothetical protein
MRKKGGGGEGLVGTEVLRVGNGRKGEGRKEGERREIY